MAARTRRVVPVPAFLLGALPWVAANHALTYAVGRVWVPLGMVPEYLEWPGSPFNRSNMTGLSRHTADSFAVNAASLVLIFLTSNLPLFLAVGFGWLALARRGPDRVEQAALAAWCACVWLVYALLSDNFGGACMSVRWFVPLLVPGFWLLAKLLAERATFRADFAVLAAGGLLLAYRMWHLGPWLSGPVAGQTAIVAGTLGAWAGVRALALWWRYRSCRWRG